VEASINNVCSVPHGAIMKVTDGRIDPSDDNKFRFIWNAKDIIENVEKVIIATDNDSAGLLWLRKWLDVLAKISVGN